MFVFLYTALLSLCATKPLISAQSEKFLYAGAGMGVSFANAVYNGYAESGGSTITFADEKHKKTKLFPLLIFGYEQAYENFLWGVEGYTNFTKITLGNNFENASDAIYSSAEKGLTFGLAVKIGYPFQTASPFLLLGGELGTVNYSYQQHDLVSGSTFNKSSTCYVPVFMCGLGFEKKVRSVVFRMQYTLNNQAKSSVSFKDYQGDTIHQSFKLKERCFTMIVVYPF